MTKIPPKPKNYQNTCKIQKNDQNTPKPKKWPKYLILLDRHLWHDSYKNENAQLFFIFSIRWQALNAHYTVRIENHWTKWWRSQHRSWTTRISWLASFACDKSIITNVTIINTGYDTWSIKQMYLSKKKQIKDMEDLCNFLQLY